MHEADKAGPPSDRTRVRRLGRRGAYDRETIYAIPDAGMWCHVGYLVDGQPYVTPTAYWREGDHVYWHGSAASRMLTTQVGGVDVCFTVSILDGLVMARSGFHHSMNYRSVMALGRAELVEGTDAKLHALEVFTDRLVPGRWAAIRPPTVQELKGSTILRLALEEASAKIRTGAPVDDEEDYELPVWAGVLPLALAAGVPVRDPRQSAEWIVPSLSAGLGVIASG